MTQIPDYVRGYCDAFQDVITIIQMRDDEMSTPSANRMANAVAFELGEDSKVLERREMFQHLRTYTKDNGILPPNLLQPIAEDFEYVEKAIADDRAVRKRLNECLQIIRISATHARIVFRDKEEK